MKTKQAQPTGEIVGADGGAESAAAIDHGHPVGKSRKKKCWRRTGARGPAETTGKASVKIERRPGKVGQFIG
jgi:hypothetical protein